MSLLSDVKVDKLDANNKTDNGSSTDDFGDFVGQPKADLPHTEAENMNRKQRNNQPSTNMLYTGQKRELRETYNKSLSPKTDDLLDDSNQEDFEPWPEFDNGPSNNGTSQIVPLALESIPEPQNLLPLFETNLFSLPAPLFQEITPLPYPLKRRVLSNPRTKQFFEGIISGVNIAIRICAGRRRRSKSADADFEAREIARLWKSLRHRLVGVGITELPTLDPDYVLKKYVGNPKDLCIVCAVSRNEMPRGTTRQASWDSANSGHVTCIKWWIHEKALLES
ncbi:hypothetical protein V1511DRAFT_505094 [Dipodascopsis uninucleata]